MLLELLQGGDSGGFLLIQDTANYSGRHLLKSFINAALRRDEEVHVFCFETSEEELKEGFQEVQRLHIHNAYEDPLGWTKKAVFTVQQFSLNDLTRVIKLTPHQKTPIVVIDSLSWVLRHVCTTAVCSTLHQLKKGGFVRAIIGLLHADMHQKGTVGSVRHLSTSLITVTPSIMGDNCQAKITKRTKSGKVLQDEHTFSIKEDLTVMLLKSSNTAPQQMVQEEHEIDPTANLTFNLRLSDKEREAKEKLSLPFMFSKEKKKAILHSGANLGRILYEPDANDDFDQEDPDDDLDV
uniref:Elongator complex protein 5 n=1 Tax=Neogobius melanostomus TaxID=47308 RepID=A0A8C6U2Q2_9GOBI